MRRNLGTASFKEIVSTTDALTTHERFRLDAASTNDYGDIVGLLTKQATICPLNQGNKNNTVSQGAVCAN